MSFTQRITPNPYIPAKSGWCLQYVRQAFDLPAAYPTATAAWNASKSQHRDRNYPKGVWFPVWWSIDGVPAGHVALVDPRGRVFSTSDLDPTPIHIHPNVADVENYYARHGLTLRYRGWTEDVAGYTVIAPSGINPQGTITKKDGFEMAEVSDVVEALLSKKVKKGDGSGDITLAQVIAWYDPNREKDINEIFERGITRGGGPKGKTSLQSTLAYLDANLNRIVSAQSSSDAQIKALVGAVAALSKGEKFDEAKLLASIQASAAAGVKEAIESIDADLTINLK